MVPLVAVALLTRLADVGSSLGIVGASIQQRTSDRGDSVTVEVVQAVKTMEKQAVCSGGSIRAGKMHWKVDSVAPQPGHAFALVELAFNNLIGDSLSLQLKETLAFTAAGGDTITSVGVDVGFVEIDGQRTETFWPWSSVSIKLAPSERKLRTFLLLIPRTEAEIQVRQEGESPVNVKISS
jgi:hypothetical protein